ncbi:MAG: hypothetical protein ACYCSI_03365 [Solirubrobacteraceae bacterium]
MCEEGRVEVCGSEPGEGRWRRLDAGRFAAACAELVAPDVAPLRPVLP